MSNQHKSMQMRKHSISLKDKAVWALDLPLSKSDQDYLASNIMHPPYQVANIQAVHNIFGIDYSPGLFFISERKSQPEYLTDEEGRDYDTWIRLMTYSYLRSLQDTGYISSKLDDSILDSVGGSCLKVMETPARDGRPLCEHITNQQVTDVLSRIIKAIITGNMFAPLHIFKKFNRCGKNLALDILRSINPSDLLMNLRRSIIAGSVGLDVKRLQVSIGPSPIVTRNTININSTIKPKRSSLVQAEIDNRAKECFAIDFCQKFLDLILTSTNNISLIWFTDDLIETVFDLYNMQAWLNVNANLNITVVPKHGQHANDASFEDVVEIISDHLFSGLRTNLGGRFNILMNGPAGSGINAFEFGPSILTALISADVVVFKGARAFEMAQGMNKEVYFGFNVLRSFTESLTGLDAKNAPSVFLQREPGMPSFNGFRDRAERKKTFGKRSIGVAKTTTIEYIETSHGRLQNE